MVTYCLVTLPLATNHVNKTVFKLVELNVLAKSKYSAARDTVPRAALITAMLQKTNFNPNRICRGLNAEVKLSGSPALKLRSLRPVSRTVPEL